MKPKSKRQQVREHNRKQNLMGVLFWSVAGLALVIVIGVIVWKSFKPAIGQALPLMTTTHIPVDTDPGQYNSDPPTSGPHYPEEANAGFYDDNIYKFPAGYLVHNLEHGYIILWYNCGLVDESGCTDLKAQIKTTMDELGNVKLVAYPWTSLDVPLVVTSWGRMQKFEKFNAEQVKAFYRANLNRAPEPDAK